MSSSCPRARTLGDADELPGLVPQRRTVGETLDVARDVARELIEAAREREGVPPLPTTTDRDEYTIVVGAKWAGFAFNLRR